MLVLCSLCYSDNSFYIPRLSSLAHLFIIFYSIAYPGFQQPPQQGYPQQTVPTGPGISFLAGTKSRVSTATVAHARYLQQPVKKDCLGLGVVYFLSFHNRIMSASTIKPSLIGSSLLTPTRGLNRMGTSLAWSPSRFALMSISV